MWARSFRTVAIVTSATAQPLGRRHNAASWWVSCAVVYVCWPVRYSGHPSVSLSVTNTPRPIISSSVCCLCRRPTTGLSVVLCQQPLSRPTVRLRPSITTSIPGCRPQPQPQGSGFIRIPENVECHRKSWKTLNTWNCPKRLCCSGNLDFVLEFSPQFQNSVF